MHVSVNQSLYNSQTAQGYIARNLCKIQIVHIKRNGSCSSNIENETILKVLGFQSAQSLLLTMSHFTFLCSIAQQSCIRRISYAQIHFVAKYFQKLATTVIGEFSGFSDMRFTPTPYKNQIVLRYGQAFMICSSLGHNQYSHNLLTFSPFYTQWNSYTSAGKIENLCRFARRTLEIVVLQSLAFVLT